MSEPRLDDTVEIPVVDVRVVGSETERTPEFGAFTTYYLLGTEQPQRILPQNEKRSKAQIICGPGFANNNTLGNVYVGTREQVGLRQGGVMASGYKFEWHNVMELWLAPDGTNSLTVTVLQERYR